MWGLQVSGMWPYWMGGKGAAPRTVPNSIVDMSGLYLLTGVRCPVSAAPPPSPPPAAALTLARCLKRTSLAITPHTCTAS